MPKKKSKLNPEGQISPQEFRSTYYAIVDLFENLGLDPERTALILMSHSSAILSQNCEVSIDEAFNIMQKMLNHLREEHAKLMAIKPQNN